MARTVAAISCGLAAWVLVATTGNLLLRFAMTGYAAAQAPTQFTAVTMVARLLPGRAVFDGSPDRFRLYHRTEVSGFCSEIVHRGYRFLACRRSVSRQMGPTFFR